MDLFEENALILRLLPSLIQNCLTQTTNYEVVDRTYNHLYSQFINLIPESSILVVDDDKSLQFTMLFGIKYVKALQIILGNDDITLKDGLFYITSFSYATHDKLSLFLQEYNLKLVNDKLTKSDEKLPYLTSKTTIVGISNWFCQCDTFAIECYKEWDGYNNEKYIGDNFLIKILNQCETKLPNKFPICCHILAILIKEYGVS